MANWGLWGCSRALTWLFWTTTGNEVCFSVIMMGLSNLVASTMSISKLKLRGRCVFADHTKMQKSPFWCPTPSSLLGNLCVYHVFYHKHHNQLVCSQPCWWTLDSKERKKRFSTYHTSALLLRQARVTKNCHFSRLGTRNYGRLWPFKKKVENQSSLGLTKLKVKLWLI